MSEPRVFMRHVRAAKLCSGGGREWFRSNGLDWSDFLANGIAGETLVELNDPMGLRALEEARKEQAA